MITISLATLAAITGGVVIPADVNQPEQETELKNALNIDDVVIDNLVIDSRQIELNSTHKSAFLALKGPNFDGHSFVRQVITQGCRLVIVDHQVTDAAEVAQLVVEDTRIALGKIAAFVKYETAPKTVGITGSSGKTTVKEMVAAILSRLGNVLATNGNFNNDIGVPLTLLRLDHSYDFAVIEMGANHLGEIEYTTGLTQPDVAVINNIAAAHLEGFGDLCGVARAKGEIFSGLGDKGVAIYNQDTNYTNQWQWRLTNKAVRTFSSANKADCYSENIRLDSNGLATFTLQTSKGSCEIALTIPGKHNVCNAVAAAAIALEFDASLDDICLGLAYMKPVQGRLNLYPLDDKKTACRIKLIDDSYNANLESVKAGIQLLANYAGKKLLILGDMGELGDDALSYHEEVGEYAKALKINTLLSLGTLSQSANNAFTESNVESEKSLHFKQRADLIKHLCDILNELLSTGQQEIAILVKGSRSAHMEYVITDIITWFEKRNTLQDISDEEKMDNKNKSHENQTIQSQNREGII